MGRGSGKGSTILDYFPKGRAHSTASSDPMLDGTAIREDGGEHGAGLERITIGSLVDGSEEGDSNG